MRHRSGRSYNFHSIRPICTPLEMIFRLDKRVALNDTSWAFLPRWFMGRRPRALSEARCVGWPKRMADGFGASASRSYTHQYIKVCLPRPTHSEDCFPGLIIVFLPLFLPSHPTEEV